MANDGRIDRRILGDGKLEPDERNALINLGRCANPHRIYAAVTAPLLGLWALRNYGSTTKQASWWGWLHHKPIARKLEDRYSQLTPLPGDEHVEYRERNGKRVRISHPYDLTWDEVQRLVGFCQANNLEMSISGGSWHYPGSTFVVILRAGPAEDGRAVQRRAFD